MINLAEIAGDIVLIKLNGVTKVYNTSSRDVDALKEISFELPDTGMVCIHGKSGSGKTTLLNIISGIDGFKSGDISLDDYSYLTFEEKDMDDFRNTHIGMVFQYFNLFDHMSVYENIELPLKIQAVEKAVDLRELSDTILAYVGLQNLGTAKIKELSGGQKQRVAIARAIIKAPQIILADEPTGNLDFETGNQIMELLKKISLNRLVVVVSHDEEICHKYADQIIRIADGEVVEITSIVNNVHGLDNTVVNCCSVFDKNKHVSKSLSFKDTIGFSIHMMSNKVIRLSFTLIVFVMTWLLLNIFVYISNYNDNTVIKTYLNQYPQNGICFYKPVEYTDLFYDNHKKNISSGEEFEHILGNKFELTDFIKCTSKLGVKNENTGYIEREVNCVFSNSSYELQYSLSSGRYTQQANEILITDYLAKNLFPTKGQVTGSVVYVGNLPLIVSGIIKTDYKLYGLEAKLELQSDIEYTMYHYNKDYNIIILNEGFRELYMYSNGCLRLDYSNFFFNDREVSYFLDGTGFVYSSTAQMDKVELVHGRMPTNNNEVLISKDIFDIYQKEISEEIIVGAQLPENTDFQETQYDFIDIHNAKYNGYYSDYLNMYEYLSSVKVVGVYDYYEGGSEAYADVILTSEIYQKIANDYYNFYLYTSLILQNEEFTSEEIVNFCDKYNILIDEPSIGEIYDFKNTLKMFIGVLRTVSVILIIITLFMLLSYVSNSISSGMKTIGILRSLGVRKRDTINIFVVESLLICAISLILSIVGFTIFASYCNNEFAKTLIEHNFDIIVINPQQLVIISAATVLFSFISLVIPILSLAKKAPIQIINEQR